MTPTSDRPRRTLRRVGLLAGVLALAAPTLAGCGDDHQPPAATSPTPIAVSPSSMSPSSVSPSGTATTSQGKPPTGGPSIAQSEQIQDAAGAVAIAESAVADSFAVEVSRDDDNGTVQWDVTVRVGNEGRELEIASDGSVLSNHPERLDEAQLGELPKVTATDAIATAQDRVPDGVVDDVELTTENGQRVWDVSVDVTGGDDWELWIDAASGKIVHEERD